MVSVRLFEKYCFIWGLVTMFSLFLSHLLENLGNLTTVSFVPNPQEGKTEKISFQHFFKNSYWWITIIWALGWAPYLWSKVKWESPISFSFFQIIPWLFFPTNFLLISLLPWTLYWKMVYIYTRYVNSKMKRLLSPLQRDPYPVCYPWVS